MTRMRNVRITQLLQAQALLVSLSLGGCEPDNRSPNNGLVLEYPSREDFTGPADAMQVKCGTLDCHGQIGRNLRLYGYYGMRLDPANNPIDPFETSDAEYDASYASVTALEPEELTRVVKGEASVIDLAFVRKPRGLEKHKGHQLMTKGDPLDRCLVGWLTAAPDPDACMEAKMTGRPLPDGGM
jgi:hypothetical protein